MALSDALHLVVVSPDNILYEGECSKIMVPGMTQDLAILPHHTPLYAQLTQGKIEITPLEGKMQTIEIESGIIRVKLERVSILVGFETRETLFKA